MRPACPLCKAPDSLWLMVAGRYDLEVKDSGQLRSDLLRQTAEIRCNECGRTVTKDESRVAAIVQFVEAHGAGGTR